MTEFHIHVDRELCIGMGNCLTRAPGVFDMDDAGFAVVRDETAATRSQIDRAIEECPVSALSLISE